MAWGRGTQRRKGREFYGWCIRSSGPRILSDSVGRLMRHGELRIGCSMGMTMIRRMHRVDSVARTVGRQDSVGSVSTNTRDSACPVQIVAHNSRRSGVTANVGSIAISRRPVGCIDHAPAFPEPFNLPHILGFQRVDAGYGLELRGRAC